MRQILLDGLGEILELPSGTLTGNEELESFENWDSLATISFIALADEHTGVTLNARQILECRTINDLLSLTGVPA